MASDLLSRLEAATGPDREVDAVIWAEIDGRDVREWDDKMFARSRMPPHDEVWIGVTSYGRFVAQGHVPKYTASVDAALTLVSNDFYYLFAKGRTRPDEPLYGAQILDQSGKIISEAEHECGPHAILLAAIKAREAGRG